MTTERSVTVPEIIELHYGNSGQVRVVPEDRDIMAMPVEMAIEACRAFKQQVMFHDQFTHLIQFLGDWISTHDGAIQTAYLTTRDHGLLFVVVQKSAAWCEEVETLITDLELTVANDVDFRLIRLSVQAVPTEPAAEPFLSRKKLPIWRYLRSAQ